MAGKSIFNDEQRAILRSTARRIWQEHFKKQGAFVRTGVFRVRGYKLTGTNIYRLTVTIE